MEILNVLFFIFVTASGVAAANYWGSDNRVVPADGYNQGRFYSRENVYQPEYYYPDEEYSNQIGRQPVHGAPAVYPVSGRHQDVNRWRHRAPPSQPGRVVVPKRNNNNNFHDNSHIVTASRNANKPAKSQIPPRKTTGLFRTSQWGSATIPYKGAKVNVPVLSGNKKAYRGTITTTVLNPQGQTWHGQNFLTNRIDPGMKAVQDAPDPGSPDKMCVRCPEDRSVVATKGTSFVLVEPPGIKPCINTAAARAKLSEVRVESLFGPRPGTTVGEGSYNMLIRLFHKGEQLTMCKYRYHVTVRKCPPLHLPDNVKVRCSLTNIWGSRCQMSCKPGYQLVGQETTECGDKLRWTNPLPRCQATKGCPLPMSPEHGRLSCETPGSSEGSDMMGSGDLLEEGSVCRYECDPGYTVPASQSHLSVIRCRSHSWNSTTDPSCQADNGQLVLLDSQYRHPMRHHRKRSACRANPCHGGGTCLNGPHSSRPVLCLCPPDREGEFCERAKCQEEMCENGGHCVVLGDRAVCYCLPGYTGAKCQHMQDSS